MDKNKFEQLKINLGKHLSERFNISNDKNFDDDIKIVLSCINLDNGKIIVDYGYMEGMGLNNKILQPIIDKFLINNKLKLADFSK